MGLLKQTTVEEMLISHKFGTPGMIGNASCPYEARWNVGEPYGLGIEFGNPVAFPRALWGTLRFPGHNGMAYGFESQNIYDQSRGAAYIAGAASDQRGYPNGLWKDIYNNLPVHTTTTTSPV